MHAATKKESCWSDGLKTDYVYHRRLRKRLPELIDRFVLLYVCVSDLRTYHSYFTYSGLSFYARDNGNTYSSLLYYFLNLIINRKNRKCMHVLHVLSCI